MSYLTCREFGPWLVVNFETDRLTDPVALQKVEAELFARLEALPVHGKAVICMEELDYTSSQLAGILLGAKRIVASRGGRFVLCRVGEQMMEMLRITRLITQFEVKPRLRDVLGADAPRPSMKRRALVTAGPAPRASGETHWID